MRYLAIDLGDKRTGLATGDDISCMVQPGRVLEVPIGDELLRSLQNAVTEADADAIVIGLPLNMDGSEGPAAAKARQFGEALAAQVNIPVLYQDERLTSYAADQSMARTGRTHKQKKSLRDALAAAEILRDFLDSRT